MNAITTQQALHTPLLGDEIIYEDEESSSQQKESNADKQQADDHDDDDDDEEEVESCFLRHETIIVPLLLIVQFTLAFFRYYGDHAEAGTRRSSTSDSTAAASAGDIMTTLSWQTFGYSIFLFTTTIWLYRQACADSKITSLPMVCLPEILVNIILVATLMDQVTIAYATMLLGGLLLAVLTFVATVHYMHGRYRKEHDNNDIRKESSKQKQVDILIV